jgi:outer membrane protein OmpA-like peptidoglycan-associated protein
MKLKTTLFAAAATIAFVPAAHAYEGLYGAIGAGLNYTQDDNDFEKTFPAATAWDSELDHNKGIGVYAALGMDRGSNWRLEGEFSYRNNDVRHLPGDGAGFPGWSTLSGDQSVMALMFNAIYDFSNDSKITPYIGAGLGAGRFEADFGGTNASLQTIAVNDKAFQLAYQGIAGVAIALAENVALDISYRYFGAENVRYEGLVSGAVSDFKSDYRTHSAFAGLRWNFGATAAPVAETAQYKDCWDGSSVPVTAECPPAQTEATAANLDPINFTVYFDYDKSNLTPEAANLVREASARALANDIETVVVQGHTDRSGGSAYNQALSQRRANAVRDALVANGVAADKIRMDAFGEDKPAKDTADGVREPLNRRSEVSISFQ